MRQVFRPAAVVLFILAPMVGELLAGASPPLQFLRAFIIMGPLYGGGAILVRELTLRWGKGWPTFFTLAAAYGIVEEGLMCKSFFDPNWPDVGALALYGRWAGVNWVWSLGLTVSHAAISIGLSVMLAELLFPKRRGWSWVGRIGMVVLAVLLAAVVLLEFLALPSDGTGRVPPYVPPMVPYLGTLLLVLVLVLVARCLPAALPIVSPDVPRAPRPAWFLLTGFAATFLFFLMQWAAPTLGAHPSLKVASMAGLAAGAPVAPMAANFAMLPPLLALQAIPDLGAVPPWLDMLLVVAFAATMVWLLRRMSGGGAAWTDRHRLALAAGAMGPFILLAPILEKAGLPGKVMTGQSFVAVAAVVFLLILWWRVRRRAKAATVAVAG